MSIQIPRLVYLLLKHLTVSLITVRSRENSAHMFLIYSHLAHRNLVLWRKYDVQEAVWRHFSWKKEVMFFYFILHKLTLKDLNSFQMYEITQFKHVLNLAVCFHFWLWGGYSVKVKAEKQQNPCWKGVEIEFPVFLSLEKPLDWGQNDAFAHCMQIHDVIFLVILGRR